MPIFTKRQRQERSFARRTASLVAAVMDCTEWQYLKDGHGAAYAIIEGVRVEVGGVFCAKHIRVMGITYVLDQPTGNAVAPHVARYAAHQANMARILAA